MGKHPVRIGFALSLVLVLPGCVMLGVVGVGANEGESANPYFGRNAFGDRVLSASDSPETQPSSQLLEDWGEPSSRVEQADGSERWRYDGSLRWAGAVIVVVIIPIPLVIPTGWEHVEFTVRDGQVVHATSSGNAYAWGWACEWAPSFIHGGGWSAGTISEPLTRFANPFQ